MILFELSLLNNLIDNNKAPHSWGFLFVG